MPRWTLGGKAGGLRLPGLLHCTAHARAGDPAAFCVSIVAVSALAIGVHRPCPPGGRPATRRRRRGGACRWRRRGRRRVAPQPCGNAPTPRIWRLSDLQYRRVVTDFLGDVVVPEVPTPGRHPLEFKDVAAVSGQRRRDGPLRSRRPAASRSKRFGAWARWCRAGGRERVRLCRALHRGVRCRAFRRPVAAEDQAALLALYEMGAKDGFAEGIRLVLEAILQSPSFVYHRSSASRGPRRHRPTPSRCHRMSWPRRCRSFSWTSIPGCAPLAGGRGWLARPLGRAGRAGQSAARLAARA